MKKFFSLIVAIVCCVGLFVGCGYDAGTDVTGIAFTSETYYVDLNVPTNLEYKILPSTASSYEPKIDFIGQPENRIKISRIEGTVSSVRVTDETFTGIEVSISYSTGSGTRYEDTCRVVLKEYPSSIQTEKDTVYIPNKGITQIAYLGLFGDELKVMDNSIYKTVVKSSDETVISVESQENVIVKSTGKQGKATVSIEVVASDGSKIGSSGLKTTVDVVVTNPVTDCAMIASQTSGGTESKIFRDMTNTAPEILIDDPIETWNLSPIFTDKEGYIVENIGCTIVSLDTDVVVIETNNDGTYTLNAVGEGEAQILLASDGYNTDGDVLIFKIKCVVKYST